LIKRRGDQGFKEIIGMEISPNYPTASINGAIEGQPGFNGDVPDPEIMDMFVQMMASSVDSSTQMLTQSLLKNEPIDLNPENVIADFLDEYQQEKDEQEEMKKSRKRPY